MPFSIYTFKGLPFGVSDAVVVYSNFMDMLVSQLRKESFVVFLDNIIIMTKDEGEHLKDLWRVLELHQHVGIHLNAKKIFLFQKGISYLGFCVNKECIRVQPDYVDHILQWPTPQTTEKL